MQRGTYTLTSALRIDTAVCIILQTERRKPASNLELDLQLF